MQDFPHDPYSGGRHLNAIVCSKKLTTLQKHFLLTLGSQLDFRDIITSKRYISAKHFAEMMSCSIRTINNLTSQLKAQGYIEIESRFGKDDRQQSNLYSLTPKIFIEHHASLWSACDAGGRVHEVQTNLPYKELPYEEEKTISKDIVKNFETPVSDVLESEIELDIPKKEKKPKKTTKADVNKAVGYLGAMFKPDGTPETKGFPWPNKQQIEAVASTLVDKYGLSPIKVWFDHANAEGGLGRMRWTPSKFDAFIRKNFIEMKNGENNE
jgi:DNA-binding transcriptional MocR family regulator